MIPLDINHSQAFKSHTYCTYLEWLTFRVWWLNRYSASVRLTFTFYFLMNFQTSLNVNIMENMLFWLGGGHADIHPHSNL